MRLAVIGNRGQLARALSERGGLQLHIVTLGRPVFDLETVTDITSHIAAVRPDVIVNTAAFTDVEGAESSPDTAFSVNHRGATTVALASARLGVPLIHLSTDYVFNGTKDTPYTEEDDPDPINVYGKSKLAGENAIRATTDDHVILRTSWVYSPHGRNFLTRILAQSRTMRRINVVCDRYGAPTSAAVLASAIERVAQNLLSSKGSLQGRGLFHLTCSGQTTWAAFAEQILAYSSRPPRSVVEPISSTTLNERARRPINSTLNNQKLAQAHEISLAHWGQALEETMSKMDGLPDGSEL